MVPVDLAEYEYDSREEHGKVKAGYERIRGEVPFCGVNLTAEEGEEVRE